MFHSVSSVFVVVVGASDDYKVNGGRLIKLWFFKDKNMLSQLIIISSESSKNPSELNDTETERKHFTII